MNKAIAALNEADRAIKSRHRYQCGLECPVEIDPSWDGSRIRVFFNSPDGQNGELYYALKERGFSHLKYEAEYFWSVMDRQTGWVISYTEGDVDIYQNQQKTV